MTATTERYKVEERKDGWAIYDSTRGITLLPRWPGKGGREEAQKFLDRTLDAEGQFKPIEPDLFRVPDLKPVKSTSAYDGKLNRKDEYKVIEDERGFGLRNVTQSYTFPPRWSRSEFALKWKFEIKKFKFDDAARKQYFILSLAMRRPVKGMNSEDIAKEWYRDALSEQRDPEMSDEDFEAECQKRARSQARRYVKKKLLVEEQKDNRDTWFITEEGKAWQREVTEYLEIAPPPKKGSRAARSS